jgi:hypothetical protein
MIHGCFHETKSQAININITMDWIELDWREK